MRRPVNGSASGINRSIAIIQNGVLANSLPDTPALGVSGDGVKFGKVCFFNDCIDPLTGTAPTGSGTPIFVEGGPGSTNFVPNNVIADPAHGVRAHYYDVTLAAQGTTTLGSDVTIDRLTLSGPTKLDIGANGNLKVWGDTTQWAGWTNVNGSLTTADFLVATGILSGNGTIDPTFLTVASALVSPGNGTTPQTLTVKGDVRGAAVDVQGKLGKLTVGGDWVGEAGPGPSYLDKDSGGPENDFTNRNVTFTTYNLMHMAKMLRTAGGIPAQGNIASDWRKGEHFGFETNPEYR